MACPAAVSSVRRAVIKNRNMETICYKLETFEGPLDLLLHLIAKNKLDIRDIPITELVDQYLHHIAILQEQNMEVASEFLEMAARLVYLKTVSLLPESEEAEELKQELSGQLLEYQECRRIAGLLSEQFSQDSFARKPERLEIDLTYRGHHTPQELLAAYLGAAGRGKRRIPPSPEEFSGIVRRRIVSVSSRIIFVLRHLRRTGTGSYADFFRSGGRSDWIATFLALLELVRGKRVRMTGADGLTVTLMEGGRHGD